MLIACEESGAVRRAFRAAGHEAWSCDLVPARDGSDQHIIGDARIVAQCGVPAVPHYQIIAEYRGVPWDLIIAFPPCTYLCNSGVRWFTTIPKIQRPGVSYGTDRIAALRDGCALFAGLYLADCPHVAVENPTMHNRAANILRAEYGIGGASQFIQPWQFGEPACKRTGLWLKGLPALVVDPREVLIPPARGEVGYVEWRACHHASPGKHRARDRAMTYSGIAAAMADQWGRFVAAAMAAEEEG